MNWWQILLIALGALLVVTTVHDLAQRKRSILRNFPVVGHLRFVLEAIGPELRQYIFTSNDGERPFSRDQRRWIYSSAKDQNTYFGFGTDNDLEHAPGYLIIKHAPFPILTPPPGHPGDDPDHRLPCAKVLGGSRGRAKAFRMPSVVNISAMSYGSLSGVGIEALNRGAELAGVLHWSGEGGISRHHEHGGDLIWQIGTGYFGCRNPDGSFSPERFDQVIAAHPKIRGVELKLSQGAKPGLGGLLPAAKITKEISEIRGIPMGEDCASPAAHSAFGDIDSMLDFVEMLAERSGLPIGIKSAVGDGGFFDDLARRMARTGRGVDWITVDGGEGGTGAGPLTFTDHVALPFRIGFSRVYRSFAEAGITDDVVFIGSGRLGLPDRAMAAFALGCDGVNVAREAMLALGCIQSQRCHTGRCPTGVATNNPRRTWGLDPTLKSVRVAHYLVQLRKELVLLSRACGAEHPALVGPGQLEIIDDQFGSKPFTDIFDYDDRWARPSQADIDAISEVMVELRSPRP